MNASRHPFLDLLDAYVLGTLDAAEEQRLEAHLAEGCVECEAALAEISDIPALLGASVQGPAPPSRVRDQLMAQIAEEGEPSAGRSSPRSPAPRRAPVILGLLAAAIAGVLFGVWSGRVDLREAEQEWRAREAQLIAERDEDRQLLELVADPGAECVPFGGTPDTPQGLEGRIIVDAGRTQAVVTLDATTLATDQDYELWAIRDGTPVSLGVIPRGDGVVARVAVADLSAGGSPAALAVSLEARGGSTTGAPATVVLVGTL